MVKVGNTTEPSVSRSDFMLLRNTGAVNGLDLICHSISNVGDGNGSTRAIHHMLVAPERIFTLREHCRVVVVTASVAEQHAVVA